MNGFSGSGGFLVQLDGLQEILADLEAMKAKASNMGDLHAQAAMLVRRRQIRHFAEQRSADGSPWKPLHPLTRMLRRGGGGAAQPLQDTGRLRASIQVLSSDSQGWEVGTRMMYAAVQQFGATIRPKTGTHLKIPVNKHGAKSRSARSATSFIYLKGATIPAREFIYLNHQELRDLAEEYVAVATDSTRSIQWDGKRYGGLA